MPTERLARELRFADGLLEATTKIELDNGLEVALIQNRQAPIVTTALLYRIGTRDERPRNGGVAHFLEHMMFKGSACYGPGEVDRLTQALGGANNAFTSHDATVYHFQFSSENWHRALDIEADRMAGLRLDEAEVESERRVILEEIAMYDNDPWSALDTAVSEAHFSDHGYGRPVLGNAETLSTTGRQELVDFHRDHYRPDGAVLAIVGELPDDVESRVRTAFAGLTSGVRARPVLGSTTALSDERRVEVRRGSVPRGLFSFDGPSALDPDHAAYRLLAAVLSAGRSSRLHRDLVEDRRLALWVQADIREHEGTSPFQIAVELMSDSTGAESERLRIEELVVGQLHELARDPISTEELERARRQLVSDWVFGHTRVYQQAVSLAYEYGLFGERHGRRTLERVLGLDVESVRAAAEGLLASGGRVLGWAISSEDRR